MSILKKKTLIIIIAIVLIIAICTILFFVQKNHNIINKNLNIGNNINNKSLQEVEEYVLNISSYTAKIEVTVESNKNVNKYVLKQEYNQQEEKQTVLEPSNIAGLETTYNEGKLTINNTKLNLQTIYEQYENAINNNLWLSSFIKDYQQSSEKNIKEDEDNFIMTTQVENGNEYVYTKILYINKETGNPTKMYIQDKNQKNAVYILYNEIKINS